MHKLQYSIKLIAAILTIFIAVGFAPVAAAPVIDGNINDWGLGKLYTDSWKTETTWLSSEGIRFIVEDNQNPTPGYHDGPTGVHIRGTSSSYVTWSEPAVRLVADGSIRLPPVGGEPYDLEAIYLNQDSTNLYLAIITSVDPALAGGARPGDIALNMDKDKTTGHLGYEYGIVTGKAPYPGSLGLKQGDIVYLPKWENKGAVDLEGAEVIIGFLPGGHVVGNLGSNFAYEDMGIVDNKKHNWVIETAIPKAMVGSPKNQVLLGDVYVADNCINDELYIPEFPTIAVSAGAIFGLVLVITMIRAKREN